MSVHARACLDLFLAMVIVGSSAVTGKLATAELPINLASAIRFGLACCVLVPLLMRREGGLPRLTARSWLVLVAQALTGSLLFNVLLLHGLELTSAATAGVIISATPACMGAISILFLGERPRTNLVLGILLAAIGAMAAQAPELLAEFQASTAQAAGARAAAAGALGGSLLGGLLVLGAAFSESLFLLLRKGLRENVSPLAASTFISLLAFLLFLPSAALEATEVDFGAVGLQTWLTQAWYALGITVAAYVLWFRGVSRARPGVASAFAGVMPVSGVALSWLILGEPWSWARAAACLLVAGGVWLSAKE